MQRMTLPISSAKKAADKLTRDLRQTLPHQKTAVAKTDRLCVTVLLWRRVCKPSLQD